MQKILKAWPWIVIGLLVIALFIVPETPWRGLVVLGILLLLAWLALSFLFRQLARLWRWMRTRGAAPGTNELTSHKTETPPALPPTPTPTQRQWGGTSVQLPGPAAKTPETVRRGDDFATFRMGTPATDYKIPSAQGAFVGKARWVRPGEQVEVAGFRIPLGMLYVGIELPGPDRLPDPALINPNLSVERQHVDISERLTDYWPSYSDIGPRARRAYLQWLADGRRDPRANLGYVFLFFYGLERRVLLDKSQLNDAGNDMPAIVDEVQRLLTIYGHSNSFRRYATGFLTYLSADSTLSAPFRPEPPLMASGDMELPLTLRLALGRAAVEGAPVPAEWALTWAWADPNVIRRTAVTRCPEQFNRIFLQRYAEIYKEGMKLTVNRTKLKVSYRPASRAWAGREFKSDMGFLPDVAAVTGPAKKLQEIVDDCTTTLDAYSRFVGRSPDKAESLEAAMLLPFSAWPKSLQDEVTALQDKVASAPCTMTLESLTGRLQGMGPLSKNQLLGLARVLETACIGMEPDILAGQAIPKLNAPVVLFAALPQEANARSHHAYKAASLVVDLATSVARADGVVSDPEVQRLTEQIERWEHLDAPSKQRLRAHLQWQLASPMPFSNLKPRLELVPVDERRTVASFLAHIAHAEGEVSVSEVKFLETVYRALQLDTQLVYSDLHIQAGPTLSPVAQPQATTPRPKKPALSLDVQRIAQMQKESEQVARLLSGIFADDEAAEAVAAPAPEVSLDLPLEESARAGNGSSEEERPYGLDREHAAFLRLLLTHSSWSRAELSDVAADLELMLDGALELVNERMWDAFGTPLTEGDDPVELNSECVEKLKI